MYCVFMYNKKISKIFFILIVIQKINKKITENTPQNYSKKYAFRINFEKNNNFLLKFYQLYFFMFENNFLL